MIAVIDHFWLITVLIIIKHAILHSTTDSLGFSKSHASHDKVKIMFQSVQDGRRTPAGAAVDILKILTFLETLPTPRQNKVFAQFNMC
jgi:hypothetical protein